MTELSERDRAILQFETDHVHWKYPAAKASRVLEVFDLTETRYYQILNHLLDQPTALVAFPQTVLRLQRVREAKRAGRTRPLGSSHDPRGYDRHPGPGARTW